MWNVHADDAQGSIGCPRRLALARLRFCLVSRVRAETGSASLRIKSATRPLVARNVRSVCLSGLRSGVRASASAHPRRSQLTCVRRVSVLGASIIFSTPSPDAHRFSHERALVVARSCSRKVEEFGQWYGSIRRRRSLDRPPGLYRMVRT